MTSAPNQKRLLALLLSAAAFFLRASSAQCAEDKNAQRPNVILIVLDAARADRLSSYGYRKNTTPNIDAIAERGVLFENHISQATNTEYFLSSFFASRYYLPLITAYRFPLWNIKKETRATINKEFDSEHIFLPNLLAASGYKNLFSGIEAWFADTPSFRRKMHYDDYLSVDKAKELKSPLAAAGERLGIDDMISWIKNLDGKRFFLYWHIMYPHSNYPVGVENEEFLQGLNMEILNKFRKKFNSRESNLVSFNKAEMFNGSDLKCLNSLYDCNLRHGDALIGDFYRKLEGLGILDNTLFIITADHGENLGEHNNLLHGGLPYDSVVHVPLIIVYPPLLPPGKRIKGFTESIDVMPTILDITGIKLPAGKSVDGKSLLASINNEGGERRRALTSSSFSTERYKYILAEFSPHGKRREYLYDLGKAANETIDVGKEKPRILEVYRSVFNRFLEPYRERYNNSLRSGIHYPFYVPIDSFKLSSQNTIGNVVIQDIKSYMGSEKGGLITPWVLKRFVNSSGLYRLPWHKPAAPLTLSTLMVNGAYNVYLLMETPEEISWRPNQLGLRYRFKKGGDFKKPLSIFPRPDPQKKHNFYYLGLGRVEIGSENLFLEISFQPPDRNLYMIRHVKFVPAEKALENGQHGNIEIDEESVERLKSLGYL